MKPLVRGEETDLIDIPGELVPRRSAADDVHQEARRTAMASSSRAIIEEMWCDQFDWVYREYDYAVFAMTIHPDVSGRPQVLLMLERIYDYHLGAPGVRFCTSTRLPTISVAAFRGRGLPSRRRARARAAARMCALCGVLGGSGHWSDSAARGRLRRPRRTADEAAGASARSRILNAVLKDHGVGVKDWSGSELCADQPHRPDRDRRYHRRNLDSG